jgi:signal transduction histidine kinase
VTVRRATITRPLLIYSLVFSIGLASLIVALAGLSLLQTARAAHLEARMREARTYARRAPWPEIARIVEREHPQGFFGVVGPDAPALGLSLTEARQIALSGAGSTGAVRLEAGAVEAYVAFRLDPAETFATARSELRRLFWSGLLAAGLLGTLLALLVSRLVLSPLRELRAVAADGDAVDPLVGAEGDTPNEIAEVAKTFRRTMRKLHEERAQIERQHRELEAMQTQLIRSSKLASVGRLAAGVAHEIGNPLAAVLGYLNLMKRGLGPEETAEVLDRSVRELNRIHDTIKKLLAYARRDESEEEPGPISSAAVVQDSLDLLRGHPALRGVELHLEVGPPEADAIARPGPLRQVLINLLINAGQALIGRDRPEVTIRRTIHEREILLEVRDNGPGIPADHLEQIFDPFFSTKPAGEGTGLGLAISRSLVEQMAGGLEAQSTLGEGAVFIVRLPRASTSAS